ncbi:squalene/phytoene synthase family protein [Nocardia sp. NBC_01009]|uniref:squalene/phytoene synthase family protein n=1 Tax=Nocardia sp. NBC_01009 TaxID=2975996 RepID=UPI003863DCBF|nr:squalene/phytoene synthase family protein [Nocardia sp. NBC_01009]
MRTWRRCLDAAGVRADTARADFSAAARFLLPRHFEGWGPLWVLAPPESLPHIAAAVALARYTDDLCDSGPAGGRTQRFEEWADHVGTALDTGSSEHRLVRAYLYSADLLNLSRTWIDSYIAGTRADLEFPGFAQEADYQRYVDTVSMPSFMLGIEVVPRLVPEQSFIASVRLLSEGSQRADHLTDVFEDLRDGRLYLPVSDLDRHRVTRADLEQGLGTAGVRALLSATACSARASLVEGERILGEVAPEYRPVFRFVIGVFHKRLDDVETRGVAIIRRPYHDGKVACLRLLARSRRMGASPKALPGYAGLGTPAVRPSRAAGNRGCCVTRVEEKGPLRPGLFRRTAGGVRGWRRKHTTRPISAQLAAWIGCQAGCVERVDVCVRAGSSIETHQLELKSGILGGRPHCRRRACRELAVLAWIFVVCW